MAVPIAVAPVQSVYANSILYGMSSTNINKLRRVQNSAAGITVTLQFGLSSSQMSRDLHWLPIKQRTDFEIAALTYKVLSTNQPTYFRQLISIYEPTRSLHSQDKRLLIKPTRS